MAGIEGADCLTLKTLADVRNLLRRIPKERRELSTLQHLEATLQAWVVVI
jgi:hypothetical protein